MHEFFYLYDPLCGWCYGAAPAVVKLELEPSVMLHPLATGLFAGGGRSMTPDFAAYAWKNDQRIAQLTGQVFSEAYREKVLGDPAGRFDSTAATRALTAVHLTEPAKELEAMHRIQLLRYVDGQDNTDPAVLVSVLRDLGLDEAVALLESDDPGVGEAMATRQAMAEKLMQGLGIRGVPALVRLEEGRPVALPNTILFEEPATLAARLGLRPDAEEDIR
ncbi:DsbA family protein [Pseudoroseomonas ludipueritiae]|uniref:DsbA family protein n=1 Tax=Pseudoroseomonas ludipueritiae TaxID=198093 RepID=UPI001EF710A2|nr:DsbA family protein [Roseomonas sp. ACRSG]